MSLTDFMTDFMATAPELASEDTALSVDDRAGRARHARFDDTSNADWADITTDDPILKTLLRDYRQAGANYKKALNEHHAAAPMAELAKDIRDTAKACVQTRLDELAAQKEHKEVRAVKPRIKRKTLLRDAPGLKKRRERELAIIRERNREERERNAELASDTFFAFLLLAMFAPKNGRSGHIFDFSDCFRRASAA